MRITVEHREVPSGLSGAKRHYYVDCQVLFSEEEKAIVKARGLAKHNFTVDPAVPPPAATHYIGAKVLRAVAPLVLLGSCVTGLAIGDGVAAPLFFLAVGMFVGSFFLKRKTDIAELPDQTISFEQLLDDPCFTIFALDPARAKTIDDALRAKLGGLKGLLIDSTDIRSKETFEL
jgi:hypothetical protein